MMDTKAKSSIDAKVYAVIGVIITVIVVFNVLASTAPDLGHAADNMTATRFNSSYPQLPGDHLPLVSLFKRGGIVFLILMAGILVAVFSYVKMRK